MDFQQLADGFHAPTCIISVERMPDGGYGDIRIVAGNAKYLEPIERPIMPDLADIVDMPEIFRSAQTFEPNSLYEKYYPKDKGFEMLCFNAAVNKTPIHTFVHMNELDLWFDLFAMPLDHEDGDICYCVYTAVPSSKNEVGISSAQSGRNAEEVLKTCIKLHSAQDFTETLNEVIHDIRLICRSEVCTLMVVDQEKKTYNILATSIADNSTVRRVTQFTDFYDIAHSWLELFGDKPCLIIKDKKDLDYIREADYPWYATLVKANVKSVVLFPLRYNSEVLGFLWATNFDTSDTMQIKDKLELTTYFLCSQLSSYRMMERLKAISYTDILTDLPNRFAFSESVKELIRGRTPFAVVSVDINAFKSINETLGFDAGNKALIEIATRWKAIAESGETSTQERIARLAGDEFALIICGAKSEQELLDTIHIYEKALGRRMTIDDCDLYITASFGYAECPADSDNPDTLLTCATAAMQEVKRLQSSDRILHFTPDLLKTERTLELEKIIREALENDTIFFNMQPQYDIEHRLRGFEVLARMKDSEGNNISPGEFIPVAEKVGLIDKLDGTVYRKSAAFFGQLLKKTGTDITVSMNVSVRHLMRNDFLNEIRSLLEGSGIPAGQLEIEITESVMIDSAEKARRCIDDLKSMGVKIALDDFGTGYSSLSYLNSFPADLLKIDKSFVDKMEMNDSSRQYVAAIISMGHIMGFKVIAEGVEEQQQYETLRDIGCDYIQGFIWGRPISPEAAEELVVSLIE